jgi:hypothetical protein
VRKKAHVVDLHCAPVGATYHVISLVDFTEELTRSFERHGSSCVLEAGVAPPALLGNYTCQSWTCCG